MTEVLNQVLNILKVTAYNSALEVTTHYISDTDWHIEITGKFKARYSITIFSNHKWFLYVADTDYSGKSVLSRTYDSEIYSADFTEALSRVYAHL